MVGMFLRHLHSRHLLLFAASERAMAAFGIFMLGMSLHCSLLAGIWPALIPLLLLFGGLGQDLTAFPGQTIGPQRVPKGACRYFRC
jgi:hypothetical protein